MLLRHPTGGARIIRGCCLAVVETGRAVSGSELSHPGHGRSAVRHDAGGDRGAVLAQSATGGGLGAAVVSEPDGSGADVLVEESLTTEYAAYTEKGEATNFTDWHEFLVRFFGFRGFIEPKCLASSRLGGFKIFSQKGDHGQPMSYPPS